MKAINFFRYGAVCALLSLAACKQDNYPAPNGGIQGTVTDAITGERIETEQPNGIRIRTIETKFGSNSTPNDFWCKADGTFANSAMFQGQYKVVPIEGPFFPADTAIVNVGALTIVNFKVTPYLTISANITSANGSVTANYTISRTRVGGKIATARTLVSAYPTVSNTINEFSKITDLNGVDDDVILNSQYTDVVSGLQSGKTYYVRVGARTVNANNKFNYSEVVKVVIP
jgi:hypothetical protein